VSKKKKKKYRYELMYGYPFEFGDEYYYKYFKSASAAVKCFKKKWRGKFYFIDFKAETPK